MPDLLVLGDGDAAAAALQQAAACGIDAVRPAFPVWSVVPGFRVDLLAAGGSVSLSAPCVLAIGGVRDRAPGMAPGMAPGPDWDVPRLLRAAMAFDGAYWHPVRTPQGRTSVPGLLAAATEAEARATVRGLLDAARQEPVAACPDIAPVRADPAGADPAVPAHHVVCPCEGVTRSAIEQAARNGARDMNQLRAFTRCGMGLCQGRQCEDAAARLLAPRVGGRVAAGQWTMRPPLFAVPLDILLGTFTYDDIPVPPPAPP